MDERPLPEGVEAVGGILRLTHGDGHLPAAQQSGHAGQLLPVMVLGWAGSMPVHVRAMGWLDGGYAPTQARAMLGLPWQRIGAAAPGPGPCAAATVSEAPLRTHCMA